MTSALTKKLERRSLLERELCPVLIALLSNSLCRAARFANFERILGFTVPSII